MRNKNWKKIKNSVDFIALTKSGTKNLASTHKPCNTNLATNHTPGKARKSRWPILKHTVTAAYYLLRGLLNNLRISTSVPCVTYAPHHQMAQKQEDQSKRSKWKILENSLHFINLSKKRAKESKVSEAAEEMSDSTLDNEPEDSVVENSEAKKKARTSWKLLKNTFSIVHFLLRTVVNHLKLNW